jgi:hypothetical protein
MDKKSIKNLVFTIKNFINNINKRFTLQKYRITY